MKTIKSYIIDELKKELRLMKRNMTKNKRSLSCPVPVSFTVELWDDETRPAQILVKREKIEDAFREAIKENKDPKTNPYRVIGVTAHLQNGKNIDIPKKYWGHLVK